MITEYRAMTPEEVTASDAYLELISKFLTPQQASDRLDERFTELVDSIYSCNKCIPEYAPVWINGLIDCIEPTRYPPVCGAKRYDPVAVDRFFFDCYAPSIACNPPKAA